VLKYLISLLLVCFLLNGIISCNSPHEKFDSDQQSELDSINIWMENSKDKSFTTQKRKTFLNKAFRLNRLLKKDSGQRVNFIDMRDAAYSINDPIFIKNINDQVFEIFKKKRDTLGLAKTHYHFALNYLTLEKMDSSYIHFNKAKKYNEYLKRDLNIGHCLYGMAYGQFDVKDFTGSEILTIQAIEYYKKVKNNTGIYDCYNILGLIFQELKEYDASLEYYLRAKEIIHLLENSKNKYITNYNNIGKIYQSRGSYKKANEYYLKALNINNLKEVDIEHYARVITNFSYNKFLSKDTLGVFQNYQTALKIRDSLNYFNGIIENKIYLSEYLAYKTDTIQAIQYAKEARNLAITITDNDNQLTALKLLSKLDKKNLQEYFNDYNVLNDSLQIKERKLRNKFTRIRFETDEYMAKTAKLSKERVIIVIVSVVVVVILGLLYYIKIQRSKNKELLFEKEQQKANEEIYGLMLKQLAVMEEGRMKERDRITEELHDGIIGDVFGARISFEAIEFKGNQEDQFTYEQLILELQRIEKEVRNISHELKSDLLSSNHNFASIISSMVENQSFNSDFQCKIHMDENINWFDLDGTLKVNMYRIIQEALRNCHKYAKATQVEINFSEKKNKVILVIKDDGCGFDLKKDTEGIGLANLKSRVARLNGSFKIESSATTGTLLEIKIPINIE
jgi:two-component system NarL family sensor kinase